MLYVCVYLIFEILIKELSVVRICPILDTWLFVLNVTGIENFISVAILPTFDVFVYVLIMFIASN